jgi:hypothetical protein
MIRYLPVNEARILYMGCVDPHLIFGCEVALDSTIALPKKLESVQENFFRAVLGLSSKAAEVAIDTETGIWPVRYRRMELALRFYLYAIQQPCDSYIYAAIQEFIALEEAGHHSWFKEFKKVLTMNLPQGTVIPNLKDVDAVSKFHEAVVKKSLDQYIEQELQRTRAKTYLIPLRNETNESGVGTMYKTRCMRQYLSDIL